MEADSGILSLQAGGLNSGTNAAVGTATLDFDGGAHTLDANSWLTGNGAVGCSAGTANFSGSATGTATVLINGGTFNFNNVTPASVSAVTITAGTLGGTGRLVAGGPLNWTAGTISGAVQCNGGTVGGAYYSSTSLTGGQLINNGHLTLRTVPGYSGFYTGSGSVISNLAGATLDFGTDVGTTFNGGTPGVIYNAGLLRKTGATGTSTINDSFQNSGTLSAQIGTVSLQGGYSLANGTLNFGLNGASSCGQITLAGAATLTGTLSATLNNGYVPSLSDSFQVLNFGSCSGLFTQTNLPPVAVWQTTYNPANVTIKPLKLVPVITWPNPADIVYGTALSGTQLAAQAASPATPGTALAGTFTYTPPAGTTLGGGSAQSLSVTFTPTDSAHYTTATANALINVLPAAPVVTWANPPAIAQGTPLGAGQLNASASVPGTFVYNPAAGTVLGLGNNQTLSVTFTPTDHTRYAAVTVTASISVVPCQTVPSGLVAWWKAEGNAMDVIGGDTGTLENGVTYVPGEVGQAFGFNGNQQMVTVGNPAVLQVQNFTIETWFQRASATAASTDPTAFTGRGQIFSYGQGGYGVGLLPSGQPFLGQIGVTSLVATVSVTDTAWHHLAVAVSDGNVAFYLDGVPPPAVVAFAPVYEFTNTAAMGGRADHLNGDDNDSFLGAIDELAIYNRALTAAEVAAIYNAGPAGKCLIPAMISWANPADVVYGIPLSAAQLNATANVAGAFSYNPPLGTVLSAGSNQTLSVTFTPTDTGDYPNPVTQTVALNVGQAPLTVTANPASMTYGGSVPALSVSYSGFVNGDTIGSLTTAASVSTTGTSASSVGGYPTTPSGAVDPNYSMIYVPGALTIDPAPLTIIADNLTMTAGSPVPALTVSYEGFVNNDRFFNDQPASAVNDTFVLSTTATSASLPGNYPILVSEANLSDPNYTCTSVPGTLTVLPPTLTITANSATMTYGGTVPVLSVSYSGFVNGDTPASLAAAPAISTTATSASGVGTYPITASGAVDSYYHIVYALGTLTVNPALLTITASSQSKTYGQSANLGSTAFSSVGLLPGDTITGVTLTSTGVAPTVGVGAYDIVPSAASGSSAGNYAITYLKGTLTVNPAPLTIIADDLTMTVGSPVPTLTLRYNGFVNNDHFFNHQPASSVNDTFVLSTTATSASPVGTYPILFSEATLSDPNYACTTVPGTLTIQKPPLTITGNSASMTYGGTVPTLSVSYSGFLNGDTPSSLTTAPSVSTTATSASRVGTYPITPSGAVDSSYRIVYVPGTLTVNPAPLTIVPTNQAKTYGQTANLGSTAFNAVGLLPGDTIAGVTLSSAGAAPTAGVGTYDLVPSAASGPRAGNYAITYVNGILAVNPAPLAITANNASKYYGQTLSFSGTEFTVSGLQNGQTVGTVTLSSTGAVSTATLAGSPYAIVPRSATGGTFTPANYTFNYVNGWLTIKPVGAPPTITAISPNAGPNTGGTTVTIYGTGFEPGATVMLGGLPASAVTWQHGTNLTAVTPPSASGVVAVVVNNPDGNGVTNSTGFAFGSGIAITRQPTPSQSVNAGQTVQLTVQATGDPTLTYQWRFNGANLLENGHTGGTRTPTLTITNVGAADRATYTCLVSNPFDQTTSAGAVVTVIVPPTFVFLSPTNAAVGTGGSASFTATANGTGPLNYTWYRNGICVAGGTSATLNLTNVTAGADYEVAADNAAGFALSAAVTLTVLDYCATVQAAHSTYPEGTASIPLSVRTFNCSSNWAVPHSPAVVWVYAAGTSRSLPVTTDAAGNGTVSFVPFATEVGRCQFAVALPGQAAPTATGSFTIIGMSLSDTSESPHLIVGVPQTKTVQLNNLAGVPLTGITASVLGAPSNVTVQVSLPSSLLASNGSANVTYTVRATGASPSWGAFAIQFTSAEDASVTLPFYATMSLPSAQLASVPDSLSGTMVVNGSQTMVSFVVTNLGGAASGALLVNLPAGAPWLSLVTAQPVASLDVDQSCQITLALTAGSNQTLGQYTGDIVVAGTNSSVSIPFAFTAVSTATGNLAVTVQDELSIYGARQPNLEGATVTVSDLLTGILVGSQVSDTNGMTYFDSLTSAYYQVAVTAPNHGSFSTTLLLPAGNPGQPTQVTAFLPLDLVNYSWTVTPATIPDTYDFTLTTVFVTEVPWPVVTITPGAINLCDPAFASGLVQMNLVITNSGLIAAQGLQLAIDHSNPDWDIIPLATTLGDLAAESSILVPVTVIRKGTATDSSVPSTIPASVNWQVAALNRTEYNTTPIFIYNANPTNCTTGSSTPVPSPGPGPSSTGSTGPSWSGPGNSGPTTNTYVTYPSTFTPSASDGAVVAVTLQIDQTAVISRNAFHATLSLANNSGAPITNFRVSINPLDASGTPATNAFFIQAPTLTGINAVDGSGSMAIGASAQANWTLIPTTNAAPTGSTQYAIGGSISYTLNGNQVTIPLFAVPITVLPDPRLYLDYFLQHDVYSQDPFTAVIEPPVPFALGLRVRNLGLGSANDFTITSGQPTIINNANGLLINFQIIDSQAGTNSSLVPSLTLDLGNLSPNSSAVGLWWMTASLEGNFTNFQATFQHSDALGGLETSVVSGVNIHEMNHVVRITSPNDDGLPDFLCNDSTNVDALPNYVYSSDGAVYPVTSLTNVTASGLATTLSPTITVSDPTDIMPTNFVYFQFVDPSGGQFAITSVKRVGGGDLLVGPNVWQTPCRPNMVPPQLNALVHIFDYASSGSYQITYGTLPVVAWANPLPITQGTPLSGVQLDATANIAGTFSYYPVAGTVLSVGDQTLQVTFTPTDAVSYPNPILQTVTLKVLPAAVPITAPAKVCPNSSGNVAFGPAGESSYSWSMVGGVITSPVTGQTITFNAGASGSVNLSLQVQDALLVTSFNSVTIPISLPPVPAPTLLGTMAGQTVDVPIASLLATAVSPSGGTLTIATVSPLSTHGGTVTLAANVIIYTPPGGGYTGPDQFTFTLADGCSTTTGTVSVTVAPATLPSPTPAAIGVTTSCVNVLFSGAPLLPYVVQWAPAAIGSWSDLPGAAVSANATGVISYSDCRSPLPATGFYRIRLGP